MFVKAIDNISRYVRPICFVERLNNDELISGTATIFFVNDEGVAITCKHVINTLINFDKLKKNKLENTELKEAIISFHNCYEIINSLQYILHPTYDIAIIKFNGIGKLYDGHCTFAKEDLSIKPGKSLCRLGYAFPEFNNYRINSNDALEFTNNGNTGVPLFPIDGIITRLVKDENKIYGIEMSTPGFNGQSGAPLFDSNGIIYGMQSLTKHYHLGFDVINQEVNVKGNKKIVSNYPFINLGQCVHPNIIKDFLKQNNITFFEE
jgi:hypothetical protein